MGRKRKAKELKNKVDSLEKALKIAESLREPMSLKNATIQLAKLQGFPPAVVVLASKVSPKVLKRVDGDYGDEDDLPDDESKALEHLYRMNNRKCCRGPAMGQHMTSSAILKVCRPVMAKYPKPKRLSQISAVLETMLSYTQVVMDEREGWDEYETWVETELFKIPLFLEIIDPTFLFIRGPNGGPPPAGIDAVLNALPVAKPGVAKADGRLHYAPHFPLQRPVAVVGGPVQAPIPHLYQFADRDDAGVARTALIAWAADTGSGNLDFARMTAPLGFVWD